MEPAWRSTAMSLERPSRVGLVSGTQEASLEAALRDLTEGELRFFLQNVHPS